MPLASIASAKELLAVMPPGSTGSQPRPFLDHLLTTLRIGAPNVLAMDIHFESLLAGHKGLMVGIAHPQTIASSWASACIAAVLPDRSPT